MDQWVHLKLSILKCETKSNTNRFINYRLVCFGLIKGGARNGRTSKPSFGESLGGWVFK